MVVVGSGGRILLAARQRSLRDMNLVGGSIEPSETPRQAAIRETWEEGRVRVLACRKVHEANGVVTFLATSWAQRRGDGDVPTAWGTWPDALRGTFREHAVDVMLTLASMLNQ